MDEAVVSLPTLKLSFNEQIHAVELSPFEWSQNLICIAFGEEIAVGEIKFQVNHCLNCFLLFYLSIHLFKTKTILNTITARR